LYQSFVGVKRNLSQYLNYMCQLMKPCLLPHYATLFGNPTQPASTKTLQIICTHTYSYRDDSAKYSRRSQTSSETTNCNEKINKHRLQVSDADVPRITVQKYQALQKRMPEESRMFCSI